jgi:CHAD domain-containing protein
VRPGSGHVEPPPSRPPRQAGEQTDEQAVEREVTLAVPSDFVLPPLTDPGGDVFAAPEETLELQATYFDTTDYRLSRAGASVRARDDGWTVKLPGWMDGEALVRGEHVIEGPIEHVDPPPEALDLVRALTRGAAVQPVAVLRTTRHRVRLRSADARDVGEVVDDRVEVRAPGAANAIESFREIEVELPSTASDAHRAVVLARLRGAGAGVADPTPKIVRALGPVATAPPDVVVPAVVGPPTVELVVRRAIATSVARLVAHDPGVRIGDDPEAVHQARVATRRLRSDLRTFRTLVDERWSDALRDELRWLGDVLGGVRDADVMLGRLSTRAEELEPIDRSAADRLLDDLREQRERAVQQLLEALRSERYDTVLDHLVLAARRPRLLLRVDDDDDREVLRALVRRPWEKLARAVRSLPDDPTDSALHEVRIKVKRARYAAEAVAPAIGKPARTFARALVALQDVLGDLQDAVVASEWLRRSGEAAPNGAQGFAAGLLAARERGAIQEGREGWRAVWDDVDRKRVRGWL